MKIEITGLTIPSRYDETLVIKHLAFHIRARLLREGYDTALVTIVSDGVENRPMDIVNEYLLREAHIKDGWKQNAQRMICKDGFNMSVQASNNHYCEPKNNDGPWGEVEVIYPSEKEDLLMEHAEDRSKPTDTIYAYVPIEVVIQVIEKHGGLTN